MLCWRELLLSKLGILPGIGLFPSYFSGEVLDPGFPDFGEAADGLFGGEDFEFGSGGGKTYLCVSAEVFSIDFYRDAAVCDDFELCGLDVFYGGFD